VSAYVLVLVFINTYGISSVNIDYPSKTLCELEGTRVTQDLQDSKYYCLERK
jgi:hypothetical protein